MLLIFFLFFFKEYLISIYICDNFKVLTQYKWMIAIFNKDPNFPVVDTLTAAHCAT